MHRLIAIHGLHGTLEDYLRPGLMLHILPLKHHNFENLVVNNAYAFLSIQDFLE